MFDWSYISLICRYLSLSHTIAKKFAKKRKHAEIDESFDKANESMDIEEEIPKSQKKKPSKRKFMKPKDEWIVLHGLQSMLRMEVGLQRVKVVKRTIDQQRANDLKALLFIGQEWKIIYMNYTCTSTCSSWAYPSIRWQTSLLPCKTNGNIANEGSSTLSQEVLINSYFIFSLDLWTVFSLNWNDWLWLFILRDHV